MIGLKTFNFSIEELERIIEKEYKSFVPLLSFQTRVNVYHALIRGMSSILHHAIMKYSIEDEERILFEQIFANVSDYIFSKDFKYD